MHKIDMSSHFHQSNLIEGFDDPAFDRQQIEAWTYIKGIELGELKHSDIMKIQKMLTIHQDDLAPNERGYYRGMAGNQTNVVVGGRRGAEASMVLPLMENWLLDYQDLDPKEAHIRFEKIHPFADGNGRTGRILMWWQEYMNDEYPTEIRYDDRWEYYKWFSD